MDVYGGVVYEDSFLQASYGESSLAFGPPKHGRLPA